MADKGKEKSIDGLPTMGEMLIASLPPGEAIGSFVDADSPAVIGFTGEGHKRSVNILRRVIAEEAGVSPEDVKIPLELESFD